MKNSIFLIVLLLSTSLFSQGFDQDTNLGMQISSPVAADLDGDGLEDIAGVKFVYAGTNSIVVHIQVPGDEVNFTEKSVSSNVEPTGKIDIGDIDGDGDMDIIMVENETLIVHLLRNDGSANFETINLDVAESQYLKMLDIDNDGDMDIAGINVNTETLYTYLNNGSTSFSLDKTFDSNDDIEFIDVADMDNDGDTDIIITFEEFTGDQIILYENIGGTDFTEKVIGESKFKSLDDVAIGDLNGDGFMDVFGVSNLSNEALLSQGDGTYVNFTMPEPGGNLISIEIADFTGEGRNDYIISNTDGIFWFRNVSYVPLIYVELNAGTVAPNYSFAKTDLSNDGDVDLVITNGEMWWLENVMAQNPSATFTLDNEKINIYPNPVSDILYVDAETKKNLILEVRDMNGKLVLETSALEEAIDVSMLPSGSYAVTVSNQVTNSSHSSLIIKE